MSTIKTWRERYAEVERLTDIPETISLLKLGAAQAEIDELRAALAEKSQCIATAECDVQVLMDAARLALGALELSLEAIDLHSTADASLNSAIAALKAAGVKP